MNQGLRIGAALACAVFLSGCANQLPQRNEHEERIERRLLDHKLHIDLGEPKVLELPQRRVRIQEQSRHEVTEYEVTRRYDRYTPYQPWRELYEMPLGLIAVVAGVGANVVNVAAFGQLPDSVTQGWINYGMSGLNPALNVESNGRAEQNLASISEQQRDQRTEQSNLPWSERSVYVQAGKQRYELTTNRSGDLYLNLLDSPFVDDNPEQISSLVIEVIDPEDNTRTQATLAVSPTLRSKLREAYALVYDDLEDDDISQWVYRVKRLSDLGFEEQASELEQSLIELTRHDAQLQSEFLDALLRDAGRIAADPGED